MSSIESFPLNAPVSVEDQAAAKTLPRKPTATILKGRFLDLVPFEKETSLIFSFSNGDPSYGHSSYDAEKMVWRYLWGNPGTLEACAERIQKFSDAPDARLWMVRLHKETPHCCGSEVELSPPAKLEDDDGDGSTGLFVGTMALIANRPENLCAEIALVLFTPAFQNTAATTEATFLLLRHCFETLKYRRIEWKTNILNHRSRQAAERLGFVFEGIFRQHMIVQNGHSRDTVWYSMLRDVEWMPKISEEGESGGVRGGGGGESSGGKANSGTGTTSSSSSSNGVGAGAGPTMLAVDVAHGVRSKLSSWLASEKPLELYIRRVIQLKG